MKDRYILFELHHYYSLTQTDVASRGGEQLLMCWRSLFVWQKKSMVSVLNIYFSVVIMRSQHHAVAWRHFKQILLPLLDKYAQQSLGKVRYSCTCLFVFYSQLPSQTFSSTLLNALASSSMTLHYQHILYQNNGW